MGAWEECTGRVGDTGKGRGEAGRRAGTEEAAIGSGAYVPPGCLGLVNPNPAIPGCRSTSAASPLGPLAAHPQSGVS